MNSQQLEFEGESIHKDDLKNRIGQNRRSLTGISQRKQWPILKKKKAAQTDSSKKKVFFRDQNVCEGYLQITNRKGNGKKETYVLAGSLRMADKDAVLHQIILPDDTVISDFEITEGCYTFKVNGLKESVILEDVYYEMK